MGAVGTVLSVAQTVFSALQTPEVRRFFSYFGNKSHLLDELKDSASTIQAVLQDAEDKQDQLPNEAKDFISKLSDAFIDLDDVLDEYRTIIQRENLHCNQVDGGKINKIFKKASRTLLSQKMSKKVKKLRGNLDAIARDHENFGLSAIDLGPSKIKREETWSYVNDAGIIGREKDKEEVVGILLEDTNDEEDVSFLTIAAMGGMGKTALAQLVYNDDRIENGFQERYWVCVSEEFELQHILHKMIKPAPGEKADEHLQRVREQIKSQRFLLVLDDVWCDDRLKWVKFKDFFAKSQRGSRILITTRIKSVAKAMGYYPSYDLAGLSVEHSRELFTRIAFEKEEKDDNPKLVAIGHEIVERSPKVPLAIRVMGGMLYGQQECMWQAFKEGHLSALHCKDEITAILKLSYNNLTSPLKSCFTFCALFPKDHELDKDVLINLWAAHGYLEPQYEGQCIEDVGEEYFTMLCNRCFFQDFHMESLFGTVFKIHDLMHDLATNLSKLQRRVTHKSIPNAFQDGFCCTKYGQP